MQYEQALSYLFSRERFGIRLGLANIRKLLQRLDNPHKNLRFIHIAGTNGKGSCCAMISSILQEQGYKVGLYTSPHLVDFRERIQINNRKISRQDLAMLTDKIKPLIKSQTFFEVTTAIAFRYFKDKKVDFVVTEVGMGGRLDATNVIRPLVSLITNVAFEHKEHLGDTIEKIAYEKAGIIKNNTPTVTSADGKALKVIETICKKRNSRLTVVKINRDIHTNLEGSFQLINASASVAAINILEQQGIKISGSSITKGLKKVIWPARMQFISKNILLDCAHNPPAVKILVKELNKLKNKYNKFILLTGIMKDKDIRNMIKMLSSLVDHMIITRPNLERAAHPEYIAKFIEKGNPKYTIIPSVKEAVRFGKSITGKKDLLFITGSIYTVGEAMHYL